jgi:hypothetical protein
MEELLPLFEEHKDLIKEFSKGIFEQFGIGGLLIIIAFVLYVLLSTFVYGELQKRWIRLLTDAEYEAIKNERINREDS